MPVVISQGALTDTRLARTWSASGGMRLDDHWMDYGSIYRGQPAVATAVDKFARNIAQLGLHVFRRAGETDRARLRSHPLAKTLNQPNPWTTTYRLIYSMIADKKIYGNAFWLPYEVVGGDALRMLRIPPEMMTVTGGLMPTKYSINLSYVQPLELRPDQVIHFRTYNPSSAVVGLSLLEPLRLSLEANYMSLTRRRDTESNAGRQPAVIKRPKSAGDWSAEAERRFNLSFTEAFRSPNGRTTPLLADDMELQLLSFNAEQSQWVQGQQLTWEEVARRFDIPLSIFGIAGAPATYSSVEEFHLLFYSDTLGPDITDAESDIMLQLGAHFPEVDMTDVYVEFNIFEKMQGTLDKQLDSIGRVVGRPIMTANEGRSRINLPHIEGGDGLAVPLNVDPGNGTLVKAPAPAAPSTNGRVPSTAGYAP